MPFAFIAPSFKLPVHTAIPLSSLSTLSFTPNNNNKTTPPAPCQRCVPTRSTPAMLTSSTSSPPENPESLPSEATTQGYTARFEYDPDICLPVDQPLSDLLDTANQAADIADEILRRYFRQSVPVDYKGDDSPVTRADRDVEQSIRDLITAKFPLHSFVGEESQTSLSGRFEACRKKGFVWVIDPIDGTRAFICGRPTFVTLISVLYNGCPIVGIVSQCITRERWVGAMRRPTTYNGQPISVVINQPQLKDPNYEKPLRDCIVQATTPEMFTGLNRILFRRIATSVRNVVYGGDGYAYAMLSSGFGDAIVEADLKVWDFMALIPIVEGAGGYMSDWGGAPLNLVSDGRVLAAASYPVFEEIVKILAIAEEEFGMVEHPIQASDNVAVHTGGASTLPEDPGPDNVESMTGFGQGEAEDGRHIVRVQVTSLNSRHCEVSLKGARFLGQLESELVALVKKMAVRGRLSVYLEITSATEGTSQPESTNPNTNSTTTEQQKLNVTVDEAAVQEARGLLTRLAQVANINEEPCISDILRFSEVLVRKDTNINPEQLLPVVKEAIVNAMDDLTVSRRREGAILEEDITRRTYKINGILDEIEYRAPDRIEAQKTRLATILQDHSVDISTPKIETELTVYADKVDISEEITRLRAHVQMFDLVFTGSHEPVGQRLAFFAQEMLREATTIAAKANDAPIIHLTIMIREEVEKIREQINNVR